MHLRTEPAGVPALLDARAPGGRSSPSRERASRPREGPDERGVDTCARLVQPMGPGAPWIGAEGTCALASAGTLVSRNSGRFAVAWIGGTDADSRVTFTFS